MDLMTDALADGRRFRALIVVDDFSCECLAAEAGRSLTGGHVVEILEHLAEQRGAPEAILSDNGSEFCTRAVDAWGSIVVTSSYGSSGQANQSRTFSSRASTARCRDELPQRASAHQHRRSTPPTRICSPIHGIDFGARVIADWPLSHIG